MTELPQKSTEIDAHASAELAEMAHLDVYTKSDFVRPGQRAEIGCGEFPNATRFFQDSEYGRLESVLLTLPPSNVDLLKQEYDGLNSDQARHAHLNKWSVASWPTASALRRDILSLKLAYEDLGVRVELDERDTALPNYIFAHDLFMMTPLGAIVGRLYHPARAFEEIFAAQKLSELGIPILKSISGEGCFEGGADALWIKPDLVWMAVNLRTNKIGFDHVAFELEAQGVRVEAIEMPDHGQHLWGKLIPVDKDRAIVNARRDGPHVEAFVSKLQVEGIEPLILRPSDTAMEYEMAKLRSDNPVPYEASTLVMPANCPRTKAQYEDWGLRIAAEVPMPSCGRDFGGAMGCATGILRRATVRPVLPDAQS